MYLTRRSFTAAGLAAGSLLALPAGLPRADEETPRRRAVPASGETVPVIGLGTNRYGVGGDRAARRPLRAALARFHELGGTLVDTAPAYRSSEAVLGELIEEMGIRDALFLATKVDREGRDAQEDRIDRSFRLLRDRTLDLMQCHNLVDWETALPVMRGLKDEGRLRYIGITTSREVQYDTVVDIMSRHELDFVQVNYSLAGERLAARRILPLAEELGIAVLVNRPFGGGGAFRRLAGTELPEWAGEFDATSWAQFLLKYVVSHPAVTAAIPGMTKVAHVDDNLGAALGRLPDAALRRRQETFFDSL